MNYEDSDIEQVLEATGKQLPLALHRQFRERLNEIATDFLIEFCLEKRDPPSNVANRLKTIANKAKALVQLTKQPKAASARMRLHAQATHFRNTPIRIVSQNANGETEEYTKFNLYPTVEDAIKSIEALALYAQQAVERENRKKKGVTDKKRHKGNQARQRFINNLAGLWCDTIFDTFKDYPGGSVKSDTQKENGPFIRFVEACYNPLLRQYPMLPKMSSYSAREHYRKTGEARLIALREKSDVKKI